MNPLIVNETNKSLYIQRNIILFIGVILLISNLGLIIGSINKKERVILVPGITDKYELEGENGFNERYIEDITMFYIGLLLDLSPNNVEHKSKIMLRHVSDSNYGELEKYYRLEAEKYKKYQLVTRYDVTNIKIMEGDNKVEVKGIYNSRYGINKKEEKEIEYEIKYKKLGGKLLIDNFRKKEVLEQ